MKVLLFTLFIGLGLLFGCKKQEGVSPAQKQIVNNTNCPIVMESNYEGYIGTFAFYTPIQDAVLYEWQAIDFKGDTVSRVFRTNQSEKVIFTFPVNGVFLMKLRLTFEDSSTCESLAQFKVVVPTPKYMVIKKFRLTRFPIRKYDSGSQPDIFLRLYPNIVTKGKQVGTNSWVSTVYQGPGLWESSTIDEANPTNVPYQWDTYIKLDFEYVNNRFFDLELRESDFLDSDIIERLLIYINPYAFNYSAEPETLKFKQGDVEMELEIEWL